MSTIDRYLVREVLKYFGIVLAAAIAIYIAVDFFENIDKFVNAGIPAPRIVEFFQLKLPLIVAQITPVGILLAILITFGVMNKHNEIIALKSGGMSVYYFLRPVFMLGLLFSALLFFLSEVVVPITTSKANEIWRMEVKKYAVASIQRNIWLKGHRSISYISYFNPRDHTISGIALNYFDQQFRLIRRIDAAKGVFQKDRWVVYDIMEQVLNKKTGSYEVKFHDQKEEKLDFAPEDLRRVAKKSEEMSFRDLLDYIRNVESEGYDATPYRVGFHDKFALPFACLIVSVMAVGMTARRVTRKDMSVNIAYGIVIVFLFWISHGFCLSLGYGGLLPPFIAAWTANFIFGCAAAISLLNAE
jgi:lipopolysaccharide export system permease protein